MKTIQYPYPIATQISISKERRICLPMFLGVPVPYVLVEDARTEHPWLGICGLDSLALLREECESLRVVAEYRTWRPTFSKAVCDKHGLSVTLPIWLMTMGSWVEVLPESTWQAEVPKSS